MSIAPMYFIQKKLHRCNLYNLISLRPMSVDCRGSSGEASSGGRNSPGCRPGVRPDEIPQPPISAGRGFGSVAEDHTGSGGISSTDRRKISFNSRKSSLWRIRSGAAEAVRDSRRSSRIAAPRKNGDPAPPGITESTAPRVKYAPPDTAAGSGHAIPAHRSGHRKKDAAEALLARGSRPFHK